ncbi:unnamed protein product [Rotaria magnacalcarata]|uniref:Kinesin light chain n=1 Tax=Rotaria magnacalcarata TaxID=392030 RepID=A0A820SFV2_9BILA|nr:unnamed protein product [Rotaria magnacalcarata]
MYEVTLPPEHLRLAITWDNVGTSLENMGEHTKSLRFHENAINIRRKARSSDHPDLAVSYNNIGKLYDMVGEREKAMSALDHALAIGERSLPPNHPHLTACRENREYVRKKM